MKIKILQETYNNLIKEQTPIDIEFTSDVYGAHHGQTDHLLNAVVNENIVGYLDYSIFEDAPYINMIEVSKDARGQSIGVKLIQKLSEEYPYESIDWGTMTGDGVKLQMKMDKIYGFDRKAEESKSNHLPYEILEKIKGISKDIYNFMSDYYHQGNIVWHQMEKYNEDEDRTIGGYDANELADIVKWIEGAKLNTNHPQDDIPYYVTEMIEEIL